MVRDKCSQDVHVDGSSDDEYSWAHPEDSTDDGEGSEATRKDSSADGEADPTAAGSREDCEWASIVKAS
ncbi:hypothetical protein F441_22256 [Phytophthora nicotianae CJ01A1]|uniref:Uncharacterized protein n=2 Tax=Phytophthora nicotianae TaxID=4792 RepID=W2VQ60_PHYNI|nr:hypothetical protein L916_11415 [Phytophthora nicotianae]ETP00321.1 hypothetical protein F441_22256 [Phytophthora nicotianae CJ01A1]